MALKLIGMEYVAESLCSPDRRRLIYAKQCQGYDFSSQAMCG